MQIVPKTGKSKYIKEEITMKQLTEKAVDLILSGIKTQIETVGENKKWIKLFVDAGDFCINPNSINVIGRENS